MIEARLGPNRTFIATKAVYGNSRKKAVQQAVQWFWKDFKGILGSAYKIMTITDPYDEVDYDENFACNDLGNKYLDESTLSRLIEDSNGDLARDESEGSEKHPPNSVKRTKRRRKQNVQLTTRLSQSPGGTIYYKMIDIADKVKNARPKVKMVKLSSKSLEKAVREVERRGLDKFEKFDTKTKSSRVSKGKVKQAA